MKKNLIHLILLCCSFSLSAKVIFVNINNPSTVQTGDNWSEAFIDIQEAITIAMEGDTIWIAQGTYYPTPTNNKDISFVIPNGVKLFGGFQGIETNLSERDFELNPTILSGDIGVVVDSIDNSYHVLLMVNVDANTLLDGFKVRSGEAVFESSFADDRNYGGGILIKAMGSGNSSKPIIRNCQFSNNVGRFGGAGSCRILNNTLIYPQFINCQFQNNMALSEGGAIYKRGKGELNDSLQFLSNCIFEENSAVLGGALSLSETMNTHVISNCIFSNSSIDGIGGGIHFVSSTSSNKLIISECEFLNNESAEGGGIYIETNNFNISDSLLIYMVNNQFVKNKADIGGAINFINIAVCPIQIKLLNNVFLENETSSFDGIIEIGIIGFGATDSYLEFEVDRNEFRGPDDLSVSHERAIILKASNISSGINNIKLNILNSLFQNINGGVLFLVTNGANVKLKTLIANCTFYDNGKNVIEKNWNSNFSTMGIVNTVDVVNSIFWEDHEVYEIFQNDEVMDTTMNDFNIHHCLLKSEDCIINGIDWCGDGMLYDVDPLFRDSLNGNFRLKDCSPLINVGNNEVVDTNMILVDFDGTERILNDLVDLGAFEQQSFEIDSVEIFNATSSNNPDGEIHILELVGANLPLSFNWSNGGTGASIENLLAGTYTVTISDVDGCEFVTSYMVDFETDLNDLAIDDSKLIVSPNPIAKNETLQISLASDNESILQVEIFNLDGKKIFNESEINKKQFYINELNSLTSGIYFMKVRLSSQRHLVKKLSLH